MFGFHFVMNVRNRLFGPVVSCRATMLDIVLRSLWSDFGMSVG